MAFTPQLLSRGRRAAAVTVLALTALVAGAGAASAASGTVNTAGAPLTVRSGPGTSYASVGTVADGAAVTISCQTAGSSVTGTYGTTTIWDKIGSGRFVSDAYVYTGSDGRVAPDCADGGSASEKVTATIDAAKKMVGKYPYSWGGGGYYGATKGVCCSPSGYDDSQVVGFDCSGLMQYAFYQGAGIKLAHRSSSGQYGDGTQVTLANRKAGDMIFWSDSSKTVARIHHVALYLGSNQIVEAADHDADLRVRTFSPTETGVMPYVVRPIS